MVQTTIDRSLGAAVPDSLLRINTAPEAGAPEPPEAAAPSPRQPLAWSALSAACRRDLVPLAAIAAAGALLDAAMVVFASDLVRSLPASVEGIVGLVVAASAARLIGGLIVGPVCRRIGRCRVVAAGGIAAAVLTPLLALAGSAGAAALLALVVGLAGAPIATAHLSILAADTPPGNRGRAFAAHAGGAVAARGVGAAVLAGVGHAVGWKWALLLALTGVIPALVVARRPDGGADADGGGEESGVAGWGTVTARVTRLGIRGGLTAGLGVAGFAALGAPAIVRSLLLHHHIHTATQATVDVIALGLALMGLPVAGVLADGWAAPDPARLSVVAAGGLFVFGAGAAAAALPSAWLGIAVALGVALAGLATAAVVVAVLIVEVVPANATVTALGLAGGVAAFWGLSAAVAADAARSAWGPGAVLAATGAASVAAAGLLLTERRRVASDMLGAELESIERDASAARRRAGSRPGALEVSNVSFRYGSQQVLFDVSIRVDEGAVVALLGTNGAGKSTLLRLVAGLDHPHRGTIRLFGEDTTYLEAEQVLGAGVALLSGGRMTFPSLTVSENIKVGAQTRARDAASLRRAEEEVFEAFPALAPLRGMRAGNLSGGQQQMLALGRTLVLRPRLLLLDELTLGLAPMVVEQLLAIVRRLNAEGATVLVVEQSANLALSLATHAYFLERGAVRFDGPAGELLTHDELLRPVFLG